MKRYFLILLVVFCVVICEDISAQEGLKTWYITLNLQKVELKDKKLTYSMLILVYSYYHEDFLFLDL